MDIQTLVLLGVGAAIFVILAAVLVKLPKVTGGLDPKQLEAMKAERDDWRETAETRGEELAEARAEIADLKARRESEQRAHEEKLKAIEEKFQLTADKIIRTRGEELNRQGTESLQRLLKPLNEEIERLKKSVVEDAKERQGQSKTIETLINAMKADSARLSQEADKLTKALTTSSKTRGDWGELVLETILQRAGLQPGREYDVQSSERDSEGRLLRPDVVVHLPQGQKLVIDSKVSLAAFNEFASEEDETRAERHLANHLAGMRQHLKDLGKKDYSSVHGGVDFVIMFVPIEGAAQTALAKAPDLTTEAVQQGVMLATPTTLMMAMRTIHNLWSIDRQNRNAQKIAEEAGKLYDKFVGFVGDLESVGTRIESAQKAYLGARNKLVDGTGNLVKRAQDLRDLGVKTRKELPSDLRKDAGAYDEDEDSPALEAPREE